MCQVFFIIIVGKQRIFRHNTGCKEEGGTKRCCFLNRDKKGTKKPRFGNGNGANYAITRFSLKCLYEPLWRFTASFVFLWVLSVPFMGVIIYGTSYIPNCIRGDREPRGSA